MNTKWPEGRVREMVHLFNGYPFDSTLFSPDGDVPLVRIRDIAAPDFQTYIPGPIPASCELRNGDLVIGMDGDFNTCLWDRGPAALNQRLCALRPRAQTDIRWLAYNLPPHLKFINDTQYATTVKHLSSGEVLAIRFPFPSYEEQRAICDFLDRETARIDALIAKQEQLIATLREDRTATIAHAVTKGLDPDSPMKESGVPGIGEVPSHWSVMPMKYLVKSEKGSIKAGPFGSDLTAAEMSGDFARVYNQRTILDKDVTVGEGRVSEEKFKALKAFSVAPRDILITTRGTIGRAFAIPDEVEVGIIHPCVIRLRLNEKILTNNYCMLLMNDTAIAREQFGLASNATTIDVIYSASLASVRVPVPPLDEMAQIVSEVAFQQVKIDQLIKKAEQVVMVLQEYRAALITDAVTGKIDVRGVA